VRFVESVSRWVGIVVHRAELVEEIAKRAVEEGRRAVAEELVTVLAHDLRNFISPVELRLGLLKRRADQEGRTTDSRDVELAQRSVRRLGEIVSDMLDVARIDQGVFQMDVRPVDLAALVEQTVTPLSSPEHAVYAKASEEVIVAADPARVRQSLENLVANAVTHSPKGSSVTVHVARERRADGEYGRVDVIDEGGGVPTEIAPHIFERFAKGRESKGGLGLGLYLARRIALMHGGDLTVESAPGKGACFSLTLPLYDEGWPA
jgi:two-component system OmpR family sensor kinase